MPSKTTNTPERKIMNQIIAEVVHKAAQTSLDSNIQPLTVLQHNQAIMTLDFKIAHPAKGAGFCGVIDAWHLMKRPVIYKWLRKYIHQSRNRKPITT